MQNEESLRPEDAAEALRTIGLRIGLDDSGKPTIDWMGITIKMAERADGKTTVVAEFDRGTTVVGQVQDESPVFEVCIGQNAVHEKTWLRAIVAPDWRGDGQLVLFGWEQIADALGVHVNTARRRGALEKYRLPVRYQVHLGHHRPSIPMSLLQAWLRDTSFSGIEMNEQSVKTVRRKRKIVPKSAKDRRM